MRALAIILAFGVLTCGCVAQRTDGPAGDPNVGPPEQVVDTNVVSVPALPKTVEEFRTWRNTVAGVPQGGAAAFVVALLVYSQDAALGLQMLTTHIDRELLSPGNKGYKGLQPRSMRIRAFRDRVGRKPYIARSYIDGTSHTTGYKLPPLPWTIRIKEVRDTGRGRSKVFVWSTGADSARPITLKVNNRGVWKAYEWSSLEVGTRRPQKAKADDDF